MPLFAKYHMFAECSFFVFAEYIVFAEYLFRNIWHTTVFTEHLLVVECVLYSTTMLYAEFEQKTLGKQLETRQCHE
jgi:hypothetical protein